MARVSGSETIVGIKGMISFELSLSSTNSPWRSFVTVNWPLTFSVLKMTSAWLSPNSDS